MYIPGHFDITDRDRIFALVQSNAFGQLVCSINGRIVATHMPFLVSEDRTRLIGHIARQNPQHHGIQKQEALVIFQGPHGYISPSWYASTGVPTWNYQAVHIYGKCRVFEDPEELKTVVESLTTRYESALHTPWKPDYAAAMLGAITGIEIAIGEIQCKFKLSQNRSVQDREQVIEQLEKQGSAELALAMRESGSG